MTGQITFADGGSWEVRDGSAESSELVSRFSEAMQLRPAQKPKRRLIVRKMHDSELASSEGSSRLKLEYDKSQGTVLCTASPAEDARAFALQLMQLSLVMSQDAQTRQGILLHGALLEREGKGFILAGRSGIGKTSACRRLSHPWNTLCDDFTLLVRDRRGAFQAHPWPTWSQFCAASGGGSWNVHHAVPLQAIFFLEQARRDRLESIGNGQAVCRLIAAWEQARYGMPDAIQDRDAQTRHLRCFDTICILERHIPCASLHFTRHGAFWKRIEEFLL